MGLVSGFWFLVSDFWCVFVFGRAGQVVSGWWGCVLPGQPFSFFVALFSFICVQTRLWRPWFELGVVGEAGVAAAGLLGGVLMFGD